MHAKESDLFHCPKCRYKCPGKNNLKKHIEVVHDKKINFTCDQCAKGFYEKGQLTNHIKSKFSGHGASQCARPNLNKRFLPRTKTVTE